MKNVMEGSVRKLRKRPIKMTTEITKTKTATTETLADSVIRLEETFVENVTNVNEKATWHGTALRKLSMMDYLYIKFGL